MVALRSLEYEPSPVPHGWFAAAEAEIVRAERRRDHEERCAEWEADERENYAADGGIGA